MNSKIKLKPSQDKLYRKIKECEGGKALVSVQQANIAHDLSKMGLIEISLINRIWVCNII